jgi:hypothetical protein
MSAVKMLCLGLIVLSTSGCTPKEECLPIPQKCAVPDVKYPDINNTVCGKDYKCIYEKVVSNYYKMQEYSEKLYNANQVCK